MSFEIGQRVDTDKGKGRVAYVGETDFSEGLWIGVVLDEAGGKNNGTVQDRKYFECEDKHGIFVRPNMVKHEGSSIPPTPRSKMITPRASLQGKKISSTGPTPSGSPGMSPAASRENLEKIKRVSDSPKTKPVSERVPSESESVKEMAKKISEKGTMPQPDFSDNIYKGPPPNEADTEYLTMQVKDLTEKLNILKEKRKEDQIKIKEREQLALAVSGYEKFKEDILKQNTGLRRNIEELQQQLKDAQSALTKADVPSIENTDLEMIIENLTTDKSILEEKNEQLMLDIDSLKLKITELETDLAIANAVEDESIPNGTNNESNIGGQAKILSAHNEKLNTAVLQMRELVTRTEADRVLAVQELEEIRRQNDELHEIVNDMEEQLHEAKKTVEYYQEQVDASLGATKLIEELTEKNLDLEDRLRKCQEEIEDFEDMVQVSEEMEQVHKENERELKAELENREFLIATLRNEKVELEELMLDAEKTILQFRRKVTESREEIQERDDQILRLQEEILNVSKGEGKPDGLMVLKNNRTFADTVRYELTQLELQFTLEHVKYLEAFLPENFSKAGGDNDLLLIYLAFPRIAAKSKLLMDLLVQKYPDVPGGMRREHVTRSHRAEQWASIDRFAWSLQALYTIVQKLYTISKLSTVERLTKLAVQQTEVAQHEKLLDQYFELLRSNRFDENTSVENIDRATLYFEKVCAIHLSEDDFDRNEFVFNTIAKFQAGFRWLLKNLRRLELALNEGDSEDSAFCNLLTQIASIVKDVDALAIRANNHIPADKDIVLTSELYDMLLSVISETDKITKALHFACANVASQLSVQADADGLPTQQMFEIFHNAVEKVYGSIQASESSRPILDGTKNIQYFFKEFTSRLERNELDKPKVEKKGFPPVVTRAQIRKEDAAEAENLRWQLQKKENQIMELGKLNKSHSNELGAMKVRLEISEKKLSESSGGPSNDKLENKYRELQKDYEKMKEEYEEIIKSRDETIGFLENDAENVRVEGKNISMQRIMDFVSPSHNQGKLDGPEANEKVNQVNKRMAALLLQFNKLSAKREEEDILGLPELKVPDVIAGPYSAHSKKYKQEEDVSPLMREAKKLQKQYGRMLIEPVNPNQKSAYEASLVAYQEKVENLRFQVQSAYARVMVK